MAKKVKTYTREERETILAAAASEALSAKDVNKKFGVSTATYYAWRNKANGNGHGKLKLKDVTPAGFTAISLDGEVSITNQVRTAIKAKVQAMVPGIITDEINGLFK